MKPRTLALATFVALFGATASFGAFAGDEKPIDETGPVTGHSLDPADPATTPAELYETDKSLAAETMDDEPADDDSDDDADDDADDDDAIDDSAAEAAAADSSEAAATDPTLTQTTAETTIPAQTGAQQARAPSDVARMDTDSNGTLEVGEISDKSALKAGFADYDLDKDGSLSVTEFQTWLGPDNLTTGVAVVPAVEGAPADTAATTTTTTDATVMSSDDDDPALAASAEELEPSDTESEDIGGEKDRPSDAGTPDVDSDEEEAADPDDNDD